MDVYENSLAELNFNTGNDLLTENYKLHITKDYEFYVNMVEKNCLLQIFIDLYIVAKHGLLYKFFLSAHLLKSRLFFFKTYFRNTISALNIKKYFLSFMFLTLSNQQGMLHVAK